MRNEELAGFVIEGAKPSPRPEPLRVEMIQDGEDVNIRLNGYMVMWLGNGYLHLIPNLLSLAIPGLQLDRLGSIAIYGRED